MPLHHISINVVDIDKARDFYVAALKPLGYKITMSLLDGKVLGFGGMCGPDFWLASVDTPSADGSEVRHKDLPESNVKSVEKAPSGRVHIAFGASNRQKVREFYKAAM
jgi:catechol 2,3-dioxygenase-like lactoylglutathione lyase family enzyme